MYLFILFITGTLLYAFSIKRLGALQWSGVGFHNLLVCFSHNVTGPGLLRRRRMPFLFLSSRLTELGQSLIKSETLRINH